MPDSVEHGSFEEFFAEAEPRVRYALCCGLGFDMGREAAAEAFAIAWTNWRRISAMENPAGYVYRVGQRFGRRMLRRRPPHFAPESHTEEIWVEPALARALDKLPARQRTAVVLVHALGHTHREVASMLGVSVGTIQTHVARGVRALRAELGAHDDRR